MGKCFNVLVFPPTKNPGTVWSVAEGDDAWQTEVNEEGRREVRQAEEKVEELRGRGARVGQDGSNRKVSGVCLKHCIVRRKC